MTTENKILDAYAKAATEDCRLCNYHNFKAGYMALLNELVPHVSIYSDTPEELYRLPEGVTKP
jgi:hypothetical protein